MPTAIPIHGQLAGALGLSPASLPDRGDGSFFRLDAILKLAESHPGLLLDRYLPFQRQHGWEFDSQNKGNFLREFISCANKALQRPDAAWRTWSRRHQRLYLADERRVVVPLWRWIVGLGNNSVLETGLTLHHVYSVPYVPGSALKGLAQALVVRREEPESVRELLPADGRERDKILLRLFGEHPRKQEKVEIRPKEWDENQAGEIVFVGAVPVHDRAPPKMVLDVMTPHFPGYYGGKTEVPLEVEDPVPVPFLAIQGGTFDLTLTPRRRDKTELLDLAFKLCLAALDELGIGGKTAKGYGYFEAKET